MKKLIAALILFSPAVHKAQGFQVNLQGQKQQGMGGAGTALMQDGAAVFFNPGGVSFLKENSISAGVTATIANIEYVDGPSSTVSRTKSPVSTPFAAYAVWGADSSHKFLSRFKFGLGAYTPFGSIVTWQDGWTGRFALTSLKLQAIFIQPTISFKICDKLGIGAGFVYANGTVELKEDLPVVDASGNYGKADLKGSAS
ncbi:MAG TPA: outer membrane protein transport protein, partial [Bacteroidia bacterium]